MKPVIEIWSDNPHETRAKALFINPDLFNYAVKSSDYVARNAIWLILVCEGIGRPWPNLRYYRSIFLQGLRKVTESIVSFAVFRAKIWTRALRIRHSNNHSSVTFGNQGYSKTRLSITVLVGYQKKVIMDIFVLEIPHYKLSSMVASCITQSKMKLIT